MATVLKNIGCLATCRAEGEQAQIHPIDHAALAWEGSVITWVGPERALPHKFHGLSHLDAGGRLVIPGLIDCHTHLAFGGWRADEFEQRLQGMRYQDLVRRGGGILQTVRETRAMSKEDLIRRCTGFLDEMVQLGITTVECKSGYGLNAESELKQLSVYRALAHQHPMRIVSTFLGAHVVPPEYAHDRSGYLTLLQRELIPRVAQEHLAQFCDVFVEDSAFTVTEARRIFQTANQFGLRPKIHADQLTDSGGARLAAEVGAISADHLEYTSDEGRNCLAKTGMVAVSLPLASLYVQQKPMSAKAFMEAGIPVAVGTDFNPGTAPSFHLPLAMVLACTLQRMTPAEALKGGTIHAAKALGLDKIIGSLEPGKQADFAVINAPTVNQWLYHFRSNACAATVIHGTLISGTLNPEY